MVDSAKAFLSKNVKKLVITVPANFTDAQRNCTKQAAKLEGIVILRIINEPTSVALAYGLGENNDKNLLVFDLRGGTFDVTILSLIDVNKLILKYCQQIEINSFLEKTLIIN